ncbi:MAG: phosphoribosylformylglycinamidine cyclo-ligase [Thermoplasmata archaeon]|nr:phosphoribosylformylglycinamidine cyclo-ligase [Thermoplasmata archaeon]
MTYARSGVDIMKEGDSIRSLVSALSFRREGFGGHVDIGGHFTGLIDIGDRYLSMCTDGVGTKMMIAESLNRWDTVGIDCMAMNVNDMICIGAEPLAFVDYIATESPSPELLGQIGVGLNEGARQSNLTIIGGETATLPEIVNGLDLAGTCLGSVGKDDVITGENVTEGDLIIGLPSTGVHSNGFSLVRRVLEDSGIPLTSTLSEILGTDAWKGGNRFSASRAEFESWAGDNPELIVGEILLEPTAIYVRSIMEMLSGCPRGSIHGMAHITGGGLRNLPRMNEGWGYRIREPLDVSPVFKMLQVLGSVADLEMYQTFNMGMGFSIVVEAEHAEKAIEILRPAGGRIVGIVTEGRGVGIDGISIEFDGYI